MKNEGFTDWLINREDSIKDIVDKTADKRFEKIGYIKKERYAGEEFENQEGLGIYFKNTHLLELSYLSPVGGYEIIQLTPEELSIICQKARELRWKI